MAGFPLAKEPRLLWDVAPPGKTLLGKRGGGGSKEAAKGRTKHPEGGPR